MRETRSVRLYLEDMLESTERALSFTNGIDEARFLEDEQLVLAIARLLETIGEAAKNVPETVRIAHPDIPWRKITGNRDRLIHAYFHVDAERLWRTVEDDLPALQVALRRPLASDGPG